MPLLTYPIQSVSIAEREFDAGYQFPLHVQTWHQLYAVLEGAVRIQVEGRDTMLKAGEALWMAPALRRHPRAASAAGRYMIVSFLSPWPELGSGRGEKIALRRTDLAEANRCAKLNGASAPEQTAAFHALCYRLLGSERFAETGPARPAAEGGLWMVEQLEKIMEANVGHTLGIEDMAMMVHASRATIGRLFRKHRRTSAAARFRHIRLEHGRQLLLTTNRSITEIALETGFSSSQHFSTVFRRHFGQPPSASR